MTRPLSCQPAHPQSVAQQAPFPHTSHGVFLSCPHLQARWRGAVWLWTSGFSFLSLSFLIYTVGVAGMCRWRMTAEEGRPEPGPFTRFQFWYWKSHIHPHMTGLPCSSDSKESACKAGDPGSIPGSGRSSGEWHGNPQQYSCLENPMDRGPWQATVHEVTNSRTWLATNTTTTTSFKACLLCILLVSSGKKK